MAFNNSTLTVKTMQEQIEFDRSELLTKELFVRGLNKMLSIYQKAERSAYPDRYKGVTGALNVDSAGLDLLSEIPTLGGDEEGLVVYDGQLRKGRELQRRDISSLDRGYYILGDGKLYISPQTNSSATVFIEYVTATTRFADDVLDSQLIPIDKDAELLCEDFILSRFYNKRNQDGLRDNYEQRFFGEISAFFAKTTKTMVI